MRRLVGAAGRRSRPCWLWRPPRVPSASSSRPRPNPNRRPRRPRPRAGAPSPTGEAIAGDLRYEAEDGDEVPAEGVELTIESADGSVHADGRDRCRGPLRGPGAGARRLHGHDRRRARCPTRWCCATPTAPRSTWRCGSARSATCCSRSTSARRRPATCRRRPTGRPRLDRPGHPLRPDHRHVRHRPVAHLRHDRPDELRPRRAGHVRCADRLPVQRDDRVAHVHRRPARHRGGRAVRSRPRPLASGGRCATGARASSPCW